MNIQQALAAMLERKDLLQQDKQLSRILAFSGPME